MIPFTSPSGSLTERLWIPSYRQDRNSTGAALIDDSTWTSVESNGIGDDMPRDLLLSSSNDPVQLPADGSFLASVSTTIPHVSTSAYTSPVKQQYNCPICPFTASKPDRLWRHELQRHGNIASVVDQTDRSSLTDLSLQTTTSPTSMLRQSSLENISSPFSEYRLPSPLRRIYDEELNSTLPTHSVGQLITQSANHSGISHAMNEVSPIVATEREKDFSHDTHQQLLAIDHNLNLHGYSKDTILGVESAATKATISCSSKPSVQWRFEGSGNAEHNNVPYPNSFAATRAGAGTQLNASATTLDAAIVPRSWNVLEEGQRDKSRLECTQSLNQVCSLTGRQLAGINFNRRQLPANLVAQHKYRISVSALNPSSKATVPIVRRSCPAAEYPHVPKTMPTKDLTSVTFSSHPRICSVVDPGSELTLRQLSSFPPSCSVSNTLSTLPRASSSAHSPAVPERIGKEFSTAALGNLPFIHRLPSGPPNLLLSDLRLSTLNTTAPNFASDVYPTTSLLGRSVSAATAVASLVELAATSMFISNGSLFISPLNSPISDAKSSPMRPSVKEIILDSIRNNASSSTVDVDVDVEQAAPSLSVFPSPPEQLHSADEARPISSAVSTTVTQAPLGPLECSPVLPSLLLSTLLAACSRLNCPESANSTTGPSGPTSHEGERPDEDCTITRLSTVHDSPIIIPMNQPAASPTEANDEEDSDVEFISEVHSADITQMPLSESKSLSPNLSTNNNVETTLSSPNVHSCAFQQTLQTIPTEEEEELSIVPTSTITNSFPSPIDRQTELPPSSSAFTTMPTDEVTITALAAVDADSVLFPDLSSGFSSPPVLSPVPLRKSHQLNNVKVVSRQLSAFPISIASTNMVTTQPATIRMNASTQIVLKATTVEDDANDIVFIRSDCRPEVVNYTSTSLSAGTSSAEPAAATTTVAAAAEEIATVSMAQDYQCRLSVPVSTLDLDNRGSPPDQNPAHVSSSMSSPVADEDDGDDVVFVGFSSLDRMTTKRLSYCSECTVDGSAILCTHQSTAAEVDKMKSTEENGLKRTLSRTSMSVPKRPRKDPLVSRFGLQEYHLDPLFSLAERSFDDPLLNSIPEPALRSISTGREQCFEEESFLIPYCSLFDDSMQQPLVVLENNVSHFSPIPSPHPTPPPSSPASSNLLSCSFHKQMKDCVFHHGVDSTKDRIPPMMEGNTISSANRITVDPFTEELYVDGKPLKELLPKLRLTKCRRFDRTDPTIERKVRSSGFEPSSLDHLASHSSYNEPTRAARSKRRSGRVHHTTRSRGRSGVYSTLPSSSTRRTRSTISSSPQTLFMPYARSRLNPSRFISSYSRSVRRRGRPRGSSNGLPTRRLDRFVKQSTVPRPLSVLTHRRHRRHRQSRRPEKSYT